MARIVKQPEERRQEIIDAARELFNTQGYDQTTVRDVMDKVGIAKGTIYHYFRSKEDMLEAVVSNIVEEAVASTKQLLAETAGNALEKLKAIIVAGNAADPNKEILDHLHNPANIGLHTRQLVVALSELAPIYEDLIKQGCEEGFFQTDCPLECAEFMLSGVQFLTDVGIYPWAEEDLQRRITAFPGLIETLLNAPPGSFDFLAEEIQ